ncbi:restriction endonuclease subunit S [Nodosilinea sp. AN01ver1]|uniref:restriction endonuclease subunit S n=1 Tax=Nodosilinea sp. AN01ver1 TaxID=3423362 RepID=UPI003D31ACB0
MTKTLERHQKGEKKALPDGWQLVKLGEVCDIIGGSTLPNHQSNVPEEERIYCLKVSDLDGVFSNGRNLRGSPIYTNKQNAGSRILAPDDVVFPKRGGAIATNKKRILKVSAVLDPNLMGIHAHKKKVLPEFLHLWFKSWDLASIQSGNSVPQINRKDLDPLLLPLPPLDEQKRIVAILNEQMAAVEKARAAAEAQLEAADALPAAYLRQVFDSPEAQTWETKRLGDVATSVQNGIYKKNEFYGHGHPFIRMYNIDNNSWNLSFHEVAQIEVDEQELRKFSLQKGDILISRVNSFELVGKCGWVCEKADGNVFENMLIRVRLKQGFDSLFMTQQLRTKKIKDQIKEVAKRAIGQSSINSTDVRNLELAIPPTQRQKNISEMINAKFKQTEDIRQSLQGQLDTINAMPAALLRRAFQGEL